MSKDDLIKRLQEIKEEVTKLGYDDLISKLPVPLDKIKEEVKHYVTVEKALTKQILKLMKERREIIL